MNNRIFAQLSIGVAAMLVATAAPAQGLEQMPSVSVAAATEAAVKAMETCREMGFRVAATVVDAGGRIKAQVRDDGAGPHTLDSSAGKAYTALSTKLTTSRMVGMVAGSPEADGLRQIPDFLILGGGIPLKSGELVVGAIGVAGAPGPENDDKCGTAGIEAIAAKLK